MILRVSAVAAFAAALAVTASGHAAQVDLTKEADPYKTCVESIDMGADDAFEMALAWRDHGGGLPAEHCAALALISLDEPGEAASRLDTLARRTDAGALAERASLLTQSGNAWLLADQADNAEAAFSAALKLTPRDPEIWVDRARARAIKQNWLDAEKDLNNALVFDKRNPETYVLRASARKAQNNVGGYRADIETALSIDPTFPEALVERGAIKLEAGDKAGARADWVQVLVRAPDSAAANAVRQRIEALEVHDP
jgi:tetratricopeptide (TPR) repeat protein